MSPYMTGIMIFSAGIHNLYHNMPEIYTYISIDESGYLWLIKTDSIFRFDFIKKEFDKIWIC